MELVTVFRIVFVIGLVAIPILYLLFGRGRGERTQERTRYEDERREEREPRSEELGPRRSD